MSSVTGYNERPLKQYEAEITFPAAVIIIDSILQFALMWTKQDLHGWIDEKVPKRTGQLRDSLHRNLETSKVVGQSLLKLYFGTHLNYAEFVNQMTTSQVAHSNDTGYAYYYGHYGKINLNDPSAIGYFFDEMIKEARRILRNNMQRAVRRVALIRSLPRIQEQNLITYSVVRRT